MVAAAGADRPAGLDDGVADLSGPGGAAAPDIPCRQHRAGNAPGNKEIGEGIGPGGPGEHLLAGDAHTGVVVDDDFQAQPTGKIGGQLAALPVGMIGKPDAAPSGLDKARQPYPGPQHPAAGQLILQILQAAGGGIQHGAVFRRCLIGPDPGQCAAPEIGGQSRDATRMQLHAQGAGGIGVKVQSQGFASSLGPGLPVVHRHLLQHPLGQHIGHTGGHSGQSEPQLPRHLAPSDGGFAVDEGFDPAAVLPLHFQQTAVLFHSFPLLN